MLLITNVSDSTTLFTALQLMSTATVTVTATMNTATVTATMNTANRRKLLVFYIVFTFNFILHPIMASARNTTILADSFLRNTDIPSSSSATTQNLDQEYAFFRNPTASFSTRFTFSVGPVNSSQNKFMAIKFDAQLDRHPNGNHIGLNIELGLEVSGPIFFFAAVFLILGYIAIARRSSYSYRQVLKIATNGVYKAFSLSSETTAAVKQFLAEFSILGWLGFHKECDKHGDIDTNFNLTACTVPEIFDNYEDFFQKAAASGNKLDETPSSDDSGDDDYTLDGHGEESSSDFSCASEDLGAEPYADDHDKTKSYTPDDDDDFNSVSDDHDKTKSYTTDDDDDDFNPVSDYHDTAKSYTLDYDDDDDSNHVSYYNDKTKSYTSDDDDDFNLVSYYHDKTKSYTPDDDFDQEWKQSEFSLEGTSSPRARKCWEAGTHEIKKEGAIRSSYREVLKIATNDFHWSRVYTTAAVKHYAPEILDATEHPYITHRGFLPSVSVMDDFPEASGDDDYTPDGPEVDGEESDFSYASEDLGAEPYIGLHYDDFNIHRIDSDDQDFTYDLGEESRMYLRLENSSGMSLCCSEDDVTSISHGVAMDAISDNEDYTCDGHGEESSMQSESKLEGSRACKCWEAATQANVTQNLYGFMSNMLLEDTTTDENAAGKELREFIAHVLREHTRVDDRVITMKKKQNIGKRRLGERDVRVKALKAAEATKKRQEHCENNRNLKKIAIQRLFETRKQTTRINNYYELQNYISVM